ncbi:jg20023 [Pararge aegeria aegeria]|uniref:Jg20023 protein n=1 Tax=Pararge aegeria aegeria TaxID=348720 RepID=A0A8S4R5M8_9NEOP|nr:jg20023 [Pararge aegeria aegeria]
MEYEIDTRIQYALRCSDALHEVFMSTINSQKPKIYETVTRLILMYGCESLNLHEKKKRRSQWQRAGYSGKSCDQQGVMTMA